MAAAGAFESYSYVVMFGVIPCWAGRQRKHRSMGLGEHVVSVRFLGTRGEEEAVACLLWLHKDKVGYIQLELSQVSRVWLSLKRHRCVTPGRSCLQAPPQDNNILVRKAPSK